MGRGLVGLLEEAKEVDHIIPHRGDTRLFYDRRNWQPLYNRCHSRKTAYENWHGGRRTSGGV
ncbi:HNH endonuclease [Histidinibacterium aquaticum]|uniref:HNH endonuclease n=1 Tax=Histidinibacterium aquaticum TaxID=2613962 RepID=A0A5J5GL38_9RHOB|nr:HNH endonuclease [Histidinibacterium aquaticum]